MRADLVEIAGRWNDARLPACCPACGRRITLLAPSPLEPAAGVLGDAAHWPSRWRMAGPDGWGGRITFTCPAERCGAEVTRRMDRLAAEYVIAIRAGSKKMSVGEDLTPSR